MLQCSTNGAGRVSLMVMIFLVKKIKELKIGWNETQLTEADFHRLCRRYGIGVQEMPLSVGGFYYRVMGRDFIAVDSKLAPARKLAVMFHELGHFLFHAPESGATANFHGVGCRTRKEREADIFALCALIPQPWIETRQPQDLIDEEGFSPETIASRYKILEHYGI